MQVKVRMRDKIKNVPKPLETEAGSVKYYNTFAKKNEKTDKESNSKKN